MQWDEKVRDQSWARYLLVVVFDPCHLKLMALSPVLMDTSRSEAISDLNNDVKWVHGWYELSDRLRLDQEPFLMLRMYLSMRALRSLT